MQITNRTIIITGASAGIGAATARAFAAAGAQVVLAARSAEPLARLAAELPGRALAVPTDVADAAACRALVDQAMATFGRVDVLVNNAGVGLAGPVAQLAPADLRTALEVDLLGPLHLIQSAVPVMRQQQRGLIINVSSVLAAQPLPYLGGYAGAKAALERMSEALRMELQGSGIAVTVVRPGTTQTAFNQRRLGRGSEQRRIAPRGVPPDAVARCIVRAAHREPRIAYVSLGDRLALIAAMLLPAVVERTLARAIGWQGDGV